MANYTANLNLAVTPEDTDKSFKTWRLEMDNDTNSNMTKIDEAVGKLGSSATAITETAFATFNGGDGGTPLKSAIINLPPAQTGSGTPSPTNIRRLYGYGKVGACMATSQANPLYFSPIQSGSGDPSPTNIRAISAPLSFQRDDGTTLTIYGGYLSMKNRTITEEWVCKDIRSANKATYNGVTYFSSALSPIGQRGTENFICSSLPNATGLTQANGCYINNGGTPFIMSLADTSIDTNEKFAAWAASHNLQVAYKLAEPVTYTLSIEEEAAALRALGENAKAYSYTLPETIYGGTLDLVSGELAVTWARKEIRSASPALSNGIRYFQLNLSPLGVRGAENLVCSALPTGVGFKQENGCYVNQGGSPLIITLADTSIDTAEKFQAWAESVNLEIAYKLAEPVIYHLSPQVMTIFPGLNHIWSTAGNVTVEHGGFMSAVQKEIEAVHRRIDDMSALIATLHELGG